MTHQEKLERFRKLVAQLQLETVTEDFGGRDGCPPVPANQLMAGARIVEGRKYAKIDKGSDEVQWQGRFMVDSDGNIFGIKAYGKVHHGHNYGTLDTINDWNWGEFYPTKGA